jgi:hypothetical protein
MADQIRPTPRSPILGLFSDLVNVPLQYMSSPQRTQQMRGVAELIRSTGVPYVLENLSYDPSGRGLFTGAGGLGGTTRLRPEAVEAAMTVAPMVGPAARVAGRGAMAVGRAGERYAERVVPQIMERGGLPAQMVSAMGQGTQSPMIVWHGSPHRFTKFDSSKIGTGEGAQAYGHGIYVAESPDVAKSYQKALSAERGFRFGDKSNLTREQVQDLVNAKYPGGYLDGVIRPSGVADSLMDDMVTGLNRQQPPRQYKPGSQRLALYEKLSKEISHADPGSLYKVDLPDEHVAKMLDWDKPLSEQAPDVQKALSVLDPYVTSSGGKMWQELARPALASTPTDSPRAATEWLRSRGIPGIRYLDGGSRGRGAGTSNFVVFPGEEDLLRILDINPTLRNPIMYEDPFRSSVR